MTYNWTKECEERLISLWKLGTSASGVAQLFGCGLTRNAILGKVDRLRKAGIDVGPARTGGAAEAARRRPKAPVIKHVAKPKELPPCVEQDPTPLLDLKPHQCRYPIDDINAPGTTETLFCGGQKKDGSSYCEHHHSVCCIPYKRRNKPLDRSKFRAQGKFVFGVAA